MAFLNVGVFNLNAKRYAKIELSKAYEINEKEKKKTYNERIFQLEHGSFTPLVMLATGGMSRECKNRCNNQVDPKKNCIFINKINWNMHTRKPLRFSE